MKKLVALIMGLFCSGVLFAATTADPVGTNIQPQDWAISVGGVGTTTTTGNVGTSVGLDVAVGRTGELVLPAEAGLRQRVAYDGDSQTVGTTALYCDWDVLKFNPVDVFVGGNVGVTYGNGLSPLWEIAPEAGFRWWVRDGVAIMGRVDFPFNLDGWDFENSLRYFLGVQIRL